MLLRQSQSGLHRVVAGQLLQMDVQPDHRLVFRKSEDRIDFERDIFEGHVQCLLSQFLDDEGHRNALELAFEVQLRDHTQFAHSDRLVRFTLKTDTLHKRNDFYKVITFGVLEIEALGVFRKTFELGGVVLIFLHLVK